MLPGFGLTGSQTRKRVTQITKPGDTSLVSIDWLATFPEEGKIETEHRITSR